MAANATIYRVELQVTDLDRHYYASHALTLAQHPSETETRLLVRLLAFALHAAAAQAVHVGLELAAAHGAVLRGDGHWQ